MMNANLLQMLMQRFGTGPRGGAFNRPMPMMNRPMPAQMSMMPQRPMMPPRPVVPPQQQQPMAPQQQSMIGQDFIMPPAGAQPAPTIFDMIRPPQQPQFNVQAAQGTKPKNYVPTQVTMSNAPMPAVFNMTDAPMPAEVFNVTPASGTKPKNYRPTSITMNAPAPAGPDAMRQMLAMMGGGLGATPFAPFGQGEG